MNVFEVYGVVKSTYMHRYALVKGSTGAHTVSLLWYYGMEPKVFCSCVSYRIRGKCRHVRWLEALVKSKKNVFGEIVSIDEYIEQNVRVFPSSLRALNDLFDGEPYSNDAITVFYGKPKVGKSLLILQEAAWFESKGYNVLIIDTEGSLRESAKYWLPIMRRRFNSSGGRIYVVKKLTLQALAQFMGKKVTVVTKGDERKGGKSEFYVIGDTVDKLADAITGLKIDIVIVDSITAPIRTAIVSAQQNNPAKSDAEGFVMGRLLNYIDRYNVGVIVTAHASFNPANPYDTTANIRGGVAIHHFAKNVVYIDKREKKDLAAYRRFWLVRYGSNVPEWSKVAVAKISDVGYVDVDEPVEDFLTDSEVKRLGM